VRYRTAAAERQCRRLRAEHRRALKRLGIDAQNALPIGQGVWAEIIRQRLAKEGLTSVISQADGDNGWCLALVEPDGERTFMSFSGVENQWCDAWLERVHAPPAAWSIFPAISWHPPAANDWSPGWNGSRR
jgi:sugar/nucleoside kinase (ribokinase family)